MKLKVFVYYSLVFMVLFLLSVSLSYFGFNFVGWAISSEANVSFGIEGGGNPLGDDAPPVIGEGASGGSSGDGGSSLNIGEIENADSFFSRDGIDWTMILIGGAVIFIIFIVIILLIIIFSGKKEGDVVKIDRPKVVTGAPPEISPKKIEENGTVTQSTTNVSQAQSANLLQNQKPSVQTGVSGTQVNTSGQNQAALRQGSGGQATPVQNVGQQNNRSAHPTQPVQSAPAQRNVVDMTSLDNSVTLSNNLKFVKYYAANLSHDPRVRINYLLDAGKKFVDSGDFTSAKSIYAFIFDDYKNLHFHDDRLYAKIVDFSQMISRN